MKRKSFLPAVLGVFGSAVCVAPYIYILVRSLALEPYYQVFLGQSQYLLRFWRSLAISLFIAFGQLFVSILAGYGFAKCRFPGRNQIFFLLMLLMIMPLQVTLAPNYLIMDSLHLLGSSLSVCLPAIFVPLGTFIMTQAFKAVPQEVIEAARLDGCGLLGTIFRIAVPISRSGVVCTFLLSFLDGWNMVEQPIVFLKSFEDYPLSVALAFDPPGDATIQLVCCVLAAIPALFFFLYFHEDLAEGIGFGGVK